MSERRKLVFWPRVDGATFQNQSEAKFCEDVDFDDKNNDTPEELSETESDAYYSPSPQVKLKPMPEKLFKVIIVGDPTVGKTSFVQRYVQDTFRRDYKGTVGVDFALKIIQWSEQQTLKIQLWDIAGQERFTWMTRVYYKDAHGCLIMFDLENKNSFLNTVKWKRDVDSKCCLADGTPIPCVLIANKCDLANRQIGTEEIESFHNLHHFSAWTEASAKTGLMVNESVYTLLDMMMKQNTGVQVNQINPETVTLSQSSQHRWKCSC